MAIPPTAAKDTINAPPPQATPAATPVTTPVADTNKKANSRFNRDNVVATNPLEGSFTKPILRYPLSIGDEEYPHYVAFYPLLRETSSYGKATIAAGGKVLEQSEQNRVDPQNNISAGLAAGAVAGIKTGGALALPDILNKSGGKQVGKGGTALQAITSVVTKLTGGLLKGAVGGAVGGAAGAGAAAIAGENKLIFGETAIVLHVNDRVSTSYKANWETADLGGLIGAVAAGKVNMDGFVDGSAFGEGADYLARKATKLAGVVGGDSLLNVLESTSKTVENPYKEQLFRHMGFRGFVFDYKFAPRNEAEAEEVFGEKGILYTFIRNMHPEASGQGLFLVYPSEFMIVMYHNGEENTYVRKISNCALTDMTIDYGSDGFTTFANGCPSEVTIRLQFTELESMTSSRIDKGF